MNNNEQVNQDLFDILESHHQDVHNKQVLDKYELAKKECSKLIKAKLSISKKQVAKVVGLALGTVVVFSGFMNFIRINNIEKSLNNDTTVVEEDTSVNEDTVVSTPDIVFYDTEIEKPIEDKSPELPKIELFDVGNNKYIDYVYNYMDTSEYELFEESSSIYKVPSQIMVAIGMQEAALNHNECLPNGKYYNGCAIGILQLEQNCNNAVSAYNYMSNFEEDVRYTDEELCNIENNIQVGCMRFQQAIEKYEGNVYVAIQAHNYGQIMMDKALNCAALEKGVEVTELLNDYQDLTWLKYVKDIHNNPKKYLESWKYDTYGSGDYLSKILSYCPTDKVTYQYNGNEVTFDLRYGISEIVNNKYK